MDNKYIDKTCPICGQTTQVSIPVEKYDKWTTSMTIQDAWPEGSATDREVLISGICPKCQKEIFD